jgi:hypothetical protein
MRQQTQTITLYKYDELDYSAQQKALAEFGSHEYLHDEENEDTLKAFAQVFPVKIKDWSYDQWRGNVSFEFTGDTEIEDLKGIRLMTYLYNNYFRYLFKGKYYSLWSKTEKSPHNPQYGKLKSRHSKVTFNNDCVFTGYCMDHDTLEPIYKFLKQPDKHTTFYELMNDCLQSWAKAASNDMESYYSEENFKATCEANEWEFLEDGTLN